MVLTGVIRKVGLCLLIPVIIGWLLIIVGFGLESTNQDLGSSAFGSIRYPWWMVILVTPFMLSAEAVYTVVDKNKLLMGFLGATVNFFSTLFLTALGFLLGLLGVTALTLTQNLMADLTTELYLQFAGALIAGVFWLILTSLSFFYESSEEDRVISDVAIDMHPLS